ncbi:MAG: DNA transposition protein, partial [Shewanella algae]
MTQDVNALCEQIRALVDSGEVTFSQIARETDKSASTISSFMNGTYGANPQNIIKSLSAWLEQYQQKSALPEGPDFVQTHTVDRIWAALRYAHQKGAVSVVHGVPGVSKTEAALRYTQGQNNVWMITVTPCTSSLLECLTELAEEIGICNIPRCKGPLSRAIKRKLKGT